MDYRKLIELEARMHKALYEGKEKKAEALLRKIEEMYARRSAK